MTAGPCRGLDAARLSNPARRRGPQRFVGDVVAASEHRSNSPPDVVLSVRQEPPPRHGNPAPEAHPSSACRPSAARAWVHGRHLRATSHLLPKCGSSEASKDARSPLFLRRLEPQRGDCAATLMGGPHSKNESRAGWYGHRHSRKVLESEDALAAGATWTAAASLSGSYLPSECRRASGPQNLSGPAVLAREPGATASLGDRRAIRSRTGTAKRN